MRARGARRALGAGPAGEDDDEAGVGLPETLYLRRRLGLRLRGVRVGPARPQARTGNEGRCRVDTQKESDDARRRLDVFRLSRNVLRLQLNKLLSE